MGPIEPISPGPLNMVRGIASRATRPADMARPDAVTGALQPAPTPGAAAPAGVGGLQQTLGQVLDAMGPSGSNDQIIQILIALMVLLAVLDNLQPTAQGGSAALGNAGGGASGGPSSLLAYTSSTSITIEQTSTTIAIGTPQNLDTAFGNGSNAAAGGRLDMIA